jgi:hypothetical protein
VKYVCQHKVLKRVKLQKVLNPKAWRDTSTYLQVEVSDIDNEQALMSQGAPIASSNSNDNSDENAEMSAFDKLESTVEAVEAAAATILAEATQTEKPAKNESATAAEQAAIDAALAEEEFLADYEELCRDMDEVND